MKIPVPGMMIAGPRGKETLRLEDPLGSGAFGVVFKAVDIYTGTFYAIKYPQVLYFGGEQEMLAFLNEVQASVEIKGLNIVQVLHVETDSSDFPPYLVMEFIQGGTLKSRLDRLRESGEKVSLNELQELTEGLINGISTINVKMLHRDLKPDNILIDGNTPKIGDFGLSKIVGAATRSKTFKGGQQIFYMAPEAWKLETNRIQIDMYATGIVLYEIATLAYPYTLPADSQNYDSVRDMHLYQQPRSLKDLRAELPIGFCHVVSRLLEKNPDDRFNDWEEARSALEKAWGSTSTSTAQNQLVISLLETTAQVREIKTKKRLEQERRMNELKEQTLLDEYQQNKLLEVLHQAVISFNEQSTLGKITESPKQSGTFAGREFVLPFNHRVSIVFSRIDPPLKLKAGNARFAAYLNDAEGYGLNYLLCRKDESDLYGKWVVCKVRHSGLMRASRPEPFGFNGPDIQEIGVADRAMHIYVVEFSDAIENAFLQIILEAMRRQGKTG